MTKALDDQTCSVKQIVSEVVSSILEDVSHLGKNPEDISVAVAMSGGVDSSVALVLLKEAGLKVKGITLKLYENKHEREGACCSFRDIADAKRVCAQFDTQHYVVNFEKEFKSQVIDKFVEDYISGKTPIPCVSCNQVIKFDYMFEMIKDLDFDFLATGHYILRKKSENDELGLFVPFDKKKDQSYFLYNITSKRLKSLLFPLGNLKKEQIREIAEHYMIQTSKKPESQDICFVEDGSYRDFLKNNSQKPLNDLMGNFIHISSGSILGRHQGIQNYTIGQRRGLGISAENPLYVVKIDEKTKEVFLGEKKDLISYNVFFAQTSWIYENFLEKLIFEKQNSMQVSVRLRSMHPNILAILSYDSEKKIYRAQLQTPQYLVCPGQACVVYDNDMLLGGGTII